MAGHAKSFSMKERFALRNVFVGRGEWIRPASGFLDFIDRHARCQHGLISPEGGTAPENQCQHSYDQGISGNLRQYHPFLKETARASSNSTELARRTNQSYLSE